MTTTTSRGEKEKLKLKKKKYKQKKKKKRKMLSGLASGVPLDAKNFPTGGKSSISL
jgi:hypothetical protein